jgi:hypothetical protein
MAAFFIRITTAFNGITAAATTAATRGFFAERKPLAR